jgi:peptidyl-prolyl cis-trans isomerase A (cyclophilin A)
MTASHRTARRAPPRRFGLFLCAVGIVAVSLAAIPSCTPGPSADRSSPLLDTTQSAETAPDVFRVRFETSRGPFVVEAHRAWAPWGVDRFYYLVRRNFYDGARFFRGIDGSLVQFGINGDPQISTSWMQRFMPDDTARHESNIRGRVSFASGGPHTRTTQLFINLRDNTDYDPDYGPIGEVVEGMSVVDSLWKGYGDAPPRGSGPDQDRILREGNEYLTKEFPKLDYIKTARLIK